MANITKPYRVMFMGTPVFACSVLQALLDSPAFEVIGVISQPDRPVGRKKELKPTPVKSLALAHNLPVYQPAKIGDLFDTLETMEIDAFITCAYGQFIPEKILKLAKINCVNAHASLLPTLRGGAPIHKAIIEGYQTTGITLMKMIKKMDAGEMYSTITTSISDEDTMSSLHDRLSQLAYELITRDLARVLAGEITGCPQDEAKATFAYNITREEERINWDLNTRRVFNQIRGLYAWPIAYTTVLVNGEVINYKIHTARIVEGELSHLSQEQLPGTILKIDKQGIWVRTGDGFLIITKLQRAGKTAVETSNFQPNSEITVGQKFI